MNCSKCDLEFDNVLEKVEFAIPGGLDLVLIKNDLENPCCPECMLEAFTTVLDSL